MRRAEIEVGRDYMVDADLYVNHAKARVIEVGVPLNRRDTNGKGYRVALQEERNVYGRVVPIGTEYVVSGRKIDAPWTDKMEGAMIARQEAKADNDRLAEILTEMGLSGPITRDEEMDLHVEWIASGKDRWEFKAPRPDFIISGDDKVTLSREGLRKLTTAQAGTGGAQAYKAAATLREYLR